MLRVAVLALVPFFALLLQHGPGEFVLKQGGVWWALLYPAHPLLLLLWDQHLPQLWNASHWNLSLKSSCTGLSRQSVTEFISAKISIQPCTWDPDRPSDKYYWLVIIIFYCWYAEGCGALQLDFYTVHWKICLIVVFILAMRFIFIAGWGKNLRFCQKSKAKVKLTPLSLRADKSSAKRAARDLGLTLDSHSRT